MCDQTQVEYKPGDVVWFKISNIWWPAKVEDQADLEEDVTQGLRKKPFAVVKFFNEDLYEFVKDINQICHYNSNRKFEFIKKGMDAHRVLGEKNQMDKFPIDVKLAEEMTNGDVNILNDPRLVPEEKQNYKDLFTAPKKMNNKNGKKFGPTPTKSRFSSGPGSSPMPSNSDYKMSKKNYFTKVLNQNQFELGDVKYKCDVCNFECSRIQTLTTHKAQNKQKSCANNSIIKFGKSVSSTKFEKSPVKRKSLISEEQPKKKAKVSLKVEVETKKLPKVKLSTKETKEKDKRKSEEMREQLLLDWNEEEADDGDVDDSVVPEKKSVEVKPGDKGRKSNATSVNKILCDGSVNKVSCETSVNKASCFDFEDNDEEDINVSPNIRFGQKLPRIIQKDDKPKLKDNKFSDTTKSSADEDTLEKEFNNIMNETSVPVVPMMTDSFLLDSSALLADSIAGKAEKNLGSHEIPSVSGTTLLEREYSVLTKDDDDNDSLLRTLESDSASAAEDESLKAVSNSQQSIKRSNSSLDEELNKKIKPDVRKGSNQVNYCLSENNNSLLNEKDFGVNFSKNFQKAVKVDKKSENKPVNLDISKESSGTDLEAIADDRKSVIKKDAAERKPRRQSSRRSSSKSVGSDTSGDRSKSCTGDAYTGSALPDESVKANVIKKVRTNNSKIDLKKETPVQKERKMSLERECLTSDHKKSKSTKVNDKTVLQNLNTAKADVVNTSHKVQTFKNQTNFKNKKFRKTNVNLRSERMPTHSKPPVENKGKDKSDTAKSTQSSVKKLETTESSPVSSKIKLVKKEADFSGRSSSLSKRSLESAKKAIDKELSRRCNEQGKLSDVSSPKKSRRSIDGSGSNDSFSSFNSRSPKSEKSQSKGRCPSTLDDKSTKITSSGEPDKLGKKLFDQIKPKDSTSNEKLMLIPKSTEKSDINIKKSNIKSKKKGIRSPILSEQIFDFHSPKRVDSKTARKSSNADISSTNKSGLKPCDNSTHRTDSEVSNPTLPAKASDKSNTKKLDERSDVKLLDSSSGNVPKLSSQENVDKNQSVKTRDEKKSDKISSVSSSFKKVKSTEKSPEGLTSCKKLDLTPVKSTSDLSSHSKSSDVSSDEKSKRRSSEKSNRRSHRRSDKSYSRSSSRKSDDPSEKSSSLRSSLKKSSHSSSKKSDRRFSKESSSKSHSREKKSSDSVLSDKSVSNSSTKLSDDVSSLSTADLISEMKIVKEAVVSPEKLERKSDDNMLISETSNSQYLRVDSVILPTNLVHDQQMSKGASSPSGDHQVLLDQKETCENPLTNSIESNDDLKSDNSCSTELTNNMILKLSGYNQTLRPPYNDEQVNCSSPERLQSKTPESPVKSSDLQLRKDPNTIEESLDGATLPVGTEVNVTSTLPVHISSNKVFGFQNPIEQSISAVDGKCGESNEVSVGIKSLAIPPSENDKTLHASLENLTSTKISDIPLLSSGLFDDKAVDSPPSTLIGSFPNDLNLPIKPSEGIIKSPTKPSEMFTESPTKLSDGSIKSTEIPSEGEIQLLTEPPESISPIKLSEDIKSTSELSCEIRSSKIPPSDGKLAVNASGSFIESPTKTVIKSPSKPLEGEVKSLTESPQGILSFDIKSPTESYEIKSPDSIKVSKNLSEILIDSPTKPLDCNIKSPTVPNNSSVADIKLPAEFSCGIKSPTLGDVKLTTEPSKCVIESPVKTIEDNVKSLVTPIGSDFNLLTEVCYLGRTSSKPSDGINSASKPSKVDFKSSEKLLEDLTSKTGTCSFNESNTSERLSSVDKINSSTGAEVLQETCSDLECKKSDKLKSSSSRNQASEFEKSLSPDIKPLPNQLLEIVGVDLDKSIEKSRRSSSSDELKISSDEKKQSSKNRYGSSSISSDKLRAKYSDRSCRSREKKERKYSKHYREHESSRHHKSYRKDKDCSPERHRQKMDDRKSRKCSKNKLDASRRSTSSSSDSRSRKIKENSGEHKYDRRKSSKDTHEKKDKKSRFKDTSENLELKNIHKEVSPIISKTKEVETPPQISDMVPGTTSSASVNSTNSTLRTELQLSIVPSTSKDVKSFKCSGTDKMEEIVDRKISSNIASQSCDVESTKSFPAAVDTKQHFMSNRMDNMEQFNSFIVKQAATRSDCAGNISLDCNKVLVEPKESQPDIKSDIKPNDLHLRLTENESICAASNIVCTTKKAEEVKQISGINDVYIDFMVKTAEDVMTSSDSLNNATSEQLNAQANYCKNKTDYCVTEDTEIVTCTSEVGSAEAKETDGREVHSIRKDSAANAEQIVAYNSSESINSSLENRVRSQLDIANCGNKVDSAKTELNESFSDLKPSNQGLVLKDSSFGADAHLKSTSINEALGCGTVVTENSKSVSIKANQLSSSTEQISENVSTCLKSSDAMISNESGIVFSEKCSNNTKLYKPVLESSYSSRNFDPTDKTDEQVDTFTDNDRSTELSDTKFNLNSKSDVVTEVVICSETEDKSNQEDLASFPRSSSDVKSISSQNTPVAKTPVLIRCKSSPFGDVKLNLSRVVNKPIEPVNFPTKVMSPDFLTPDMIKEIFKKDKLNTSPSEPGTSLPMICPIIVPPQAVLEEKSTAATTSSCGIPVSFNPPSSLVAGNNFPQGFSTSDVQNMELDINSMPIVIADSPEIITSVSNSISLPSTSSVILDSFSPASSGCSKSRDSAKPESKSARKFVTCVYAKLVAPNTIKPGPGYKIYRIPGKNRFLKTGATTTTTASRELPPVSTINNSMRRNVNVARLNKGTDRIILVSESRRIVFKSDNRNNELKDSPKENLSVTIPNKEAGTSSKSNVICDPARFPGFHIKTFYIPGKINPQIRTPVKIFSNKSSGSGSSKTLVGINVASNVPGTSKKVVRFKEPETTRSVRTGPRLVASNRRPGIFKKPISPSTSAKELKLTPVVNSNSRLSDSVNSEIIIGSDTATIGDNRFNETDVQVHAGQSFHPLRLNRPKKIVLPAIKPCTDILAKALADTQVLQSDIEMPENKSELPPVMSAISQPSYSMSSNIPRTVYSSLGRPAMSSSEFLEKGLSSRTVRVKFSTPVVVQPSMPLLNEDVKMPSVEDCGASSSSPVESSEFIDSSTDVADHEVVVTSDSDYSQNYISHCDSNKEQVGTSISATKLTADINLAEIELPPGQPPNTADSNLPDISAIPLPPEPYSGHNILTSSNVPIEIPNSLPVSECPDTFQSNTPSDKSHYSSIFQGVSNS